jgi:hypothetical protein
MKERWIAQRFGMRILRKGEIFIKMRLNIYRIIEEYQKNGHICLRGLASPITVEMGSMTFVSGSRELAVSHLNPLVYSRKEA